ncbi:hypothetical protein K450DRAFT_245427 [Umbelopsis ramanniana AG]|uniref:Chitin-binding type-4 domain-containing protein n=1 Tax=Umbelopsis ramanniana AG TaxID=1314678 RepID=A0AAD5EAQ7_UMBRA|nr:uncharacterized protein K450DRAFT_245427 [Umbelopsis ramanniana AG]KAI8578770.1 hypothetical protein K450DRAFT_245427 [Umbelopsis ramanniana AG]
MASPISFVLLALCLVFTLAPWAANAHGRLIIPIGREGSTDAPITTLPCNSLNSSSPVATYVQGSKVQLSWTITEVHDATSTCYIDISKGTDDSSFTKLATLEQCASYLGTYVANVDLPSEWDGQGTLRWWWHVQSLNVTFATCSDITLVKSSS